MKKIILITGGILVFLLVAGAGGIYFTIASSFQKDLDASLDKVRKSGRPMTAAELMPVKVDADKNAALVLAKAFDKKPAVAAAGTPVGAIPTPAGPGKTAGTATSPATATATVTVAAASTASATETSPETTVKPGTATAAPPAATERLQEIPAPDLAKLLDKSPNFSLWTPAEKKEIAALLQTPAFKAFFDVIEEASRKPSCNFGVDYTKYTDKAPPHLERVRDTVLSLTLKAQIEGWSGNAAKAADTAMVAVKTAQFLQNEPSLISQLMRFSCERIICTCLEALAFNYDLPAEKTKQLMTELERMADTAPLVHAMDGERVFFGQEEFGRLLDGEDSVNDLIKNSGIDQESLLAWKMAKPMGNSVVKKDYAVYLDMLLKIQENLKVPYFQTIEQRKQNPIEKQIPSYCVVSRLTIPAIDTILERSAGAQACLSKCRSNLGLNLFRQKQNRYPVMLDELVPEYLTALPIDPFTGQSFEYRRAQKGYFINCLRGSDVGGAEVELAKDKLFSSFTTNRPGAKTALAKTP